MRLRLVCKNFISEAMPLSIYVILALLSQLVTSQATFNALSSNFKRQAQECKPTVVLTRCNVKFDDTNPNWIWRRQTEYLIEAQITKSCTTSSLLTSWTMDFRDFPGNSRPYPEFENKPHFHVKYYSLGTGAYVLTLTVTEVAPNSKYETDAKCLIKIREEAPIPVISGGSYRKVTSDKDFVVEGYTSINMNVAPWIAASLDYKWSCTATPPNSFCPTNFRGNNLDVPLTFAKIGTRYDVVLDVSANGKDWFRTKQTIDVQKDARSVSIVCMKNCRTKIDSRRIIYLKAKCDDCLNFENNIKWSLDVISSNSKQTVDFNSETANGDASSKLVIKENVLQVNDVYRFRVKYKGGEGESAEDISIAPIPNLGKCAIDPTRGQSLVTQFRVTCQGFLHNEPITYNLYNKELKTLLSVSDDGVFEYFYLSAGAKQILQVRVLDDDGLFNELEIEVDVTPATNDLTKLMSIYKGSDPPYESVKLLLSEGKVDRAVQLIAAIAVEMKSCEGSEEILELQKLLLEDLESIDLISEKNLQQVATTLKTINVEFDRLFTKSSNKLAVKVSSSLLKKVVESPQKFILETLAMDVAKSLITATSLHSKEQQDDLRKEDDPFKLTLPAEFIDSPAITEHYPNYDDADLDYLVKVKDYENIANSKIETAREVDLAVAFTMSAGQPAWEFSGHTVVADYSNLLSARPIGTKDKFVQGGQAIAEFGDDIAFGLVTDLNESSFWWKADQINSPNSAITTNYYVPRLGTFIFESPMEIFFKTNDVVLNETAQSVWVPHLGDLTPHEVESNMNVHRVDVEKGAILIITFKADQDFKFKVVIKYNTRPSYLDFREHLTVTQANNRLISPFPNNMLEYGDAWVYVAVLPGKTSFVKRDESALRNSLRAEDGITTNYTVAFQSPRCLFWDENDWLSKTCHEIYYLCDNLADDLYGYLVIVQTGGKASAGTTSNISLKVFGTNHSCKTHVINFPDPEKRLLQSGNQDWFVLSCLNHLGDLTHIYLWHDSVGLNESWYCEWIVIKDLQTNKEWFFDVQQLFSVLEGEQNYVQVEPWIEKFDGKGILAWAKKFYAYFKLKHSWNLRKEFGEDDLTYTEQVTIMLSTILCTLFFSILLTGSPEFHSYDGFGPGHFIVPESIFLVAFIASWVSVIVNFLITIMFQQKNKLIAWNLSYSSLAWFLIITTNVVYLSYFMVCGPWFPHFSGWPLVTICIADLIKSVILVEGFLLILKFRCGIKRKTPKLSVNSSEIIKQSDSQRFYLHSTFGEKLLQNYIGEKYRPLTKEEWKVKREKEAARVKITQQLQDLVMFLIYLVVLYFIVFANRDSLNIYSNLKMKELLYGLQTRTNHFKDVQTIPQFLEFINKTIVPVTHPVNWYGSYNLLNPGNLADFNTKIMGVVRLRQLRVGKTCLVPKQIDTLNLTCLPEFTGRSSDVGSYSEYWKPNKKATVARLGDTWNYLHEASPTLGHMTVYPGGGFSSPLGRTLHNSLYNLRYLIQTNWLDKKTRAIFVEFLCYNANYNIFHAVKLTIEISSSGLLVKSSVIFTARFFFVNYEYEIMAFVAFVIFLAILAVMTFKHVYGAVFKWRSFVRDVWNYVDLFIIVISVVWISLFLHRSFLVGDFLGELVEARHNQIVSYYHLIFLEEFLILIAAVLICVATIRLWKLSRFATVFQIAEKTIILATPSLLAVIFFHLIFFLAYSIIGYLMFGSKLSYYSSFGHSFSSTLLLALSLHSHFDFSHLRDEFETFGYIYYISYNIITIVMVTLYVAVITISYHGSSSAFSHRKLYYTVAKYIKDHARYKKEFLKKKARLSGGSDENVQIKVTPKADEYRYADPVMVSKFKLHCMSEIAQSIVCNKFKTKPNEMSDYKMNLMRKVVFYNFHKDKLREPKEVGFVGKERGESGNIKIVPDRRMLEMEFVANYVVNEGTKANSKVNYFDKVKPVEIEKEVVEEKVEDMDKFQYIEETLKSLLHIVDNIKIVDSK